MLEKLFVTNWRPTVVRTKLRWNYEKDSQEKTIHKINSIGIHLDEWFLSWWGTIHREERGYWEEYNIMPEIL